MAYADFTIYSDTYMGVAIAQADFPRLALRASEFIDQVTHDRAAAVVEADTDNTAIASIQMATCAVAEKIQELEVSGGTLASESVGRGFSATYQSKLFDDGQLIRVAKKYLGRTGLMYSGFADDEYGSDGHRVWGWS